MARPSAGATPRTSKKDAVTRRPSTFCGSPSPVSVNASSATAASVSKDCAWSRRAAYVAGERSFRGKPILDAFSQTVTMRSGSRSGGRPSRTALVRLKIAVLPPIPKASVATAIAVKPGLPRRDRRA